MKSANYFLERMYWNQCALSHLRRNFVKDNIFFRKIRNTHNLVSYRSMSQSWTQVPHRQLNFSKCKQLLSLKKKKFECDGWGLVTIDLSGGHSSVITLTRSSISCAEGEDDWLTAMNGWHILKFITQQLLWKRSPTSFDAHLEFTGTFRFVHAYDFIHYYKDIPIALA